MTSEGMQQPIFTYEVSPSESFSEGVIAAVSAASGTDSIAPKEATSSAEVLEPLYSVVDPDALDGLFRGRDSGRGSVEVSFAYHDHEVTVSGGGQIEVEPRSAADEASD
ncbi:hypothetical protein M0R88_15210 [Halorussus gelatinilyticus]|uniref:Halobacterial output domain-containing protein n=1 Tax=Halorussus gelatinilyticus TaxID=2937524 RepID=A0A8U0IGJ9_9EURY|nr:HalOD1 output domain-containing protein [Halorussus gelatinilyticus]UPV99854.1 hypothetical protein M0R88_15210 [Halorussus gelatinilyticus]